MTTLPRIDPAYLNRILTSEGPAQADLLTTWFQEPSVAGDTVTLTAKHPAMVPDFVARDVAPRTDSLWPWVRDFLIQHLADPAYQSLIDDALAANVELDRHTPMTILDSLSNPNVSEEDRITLMVHCMAAIDRRVDGPKTYLVCQPKPESPVQGIFETTITQAGAGANGLRPALVRALENFQETLLHQISRLQPRIYS